LCRFAVEERHVDASVGPRAFPRGVRGDAHPGEAPAVGVA
jgi:hypothetical protein